MKKVLFFTLLVAAFSLAGCNRSQATTTAPVQNQNATATAPAVQTTPAVAPSTAPGVATPMSSPVPIPFMTGKPEKNAKGKKKVTQAPQMPPGMDRGTPGARLAGDAVHERFSRPLGHDGVREFIVTTGFDDVGDDGERAQALDQQSKQRDGEGL